VSVMLSRKTDGGNGEHHPYGDMVRARRGPVGGWLTLVPRWPAFFMPVPDLAHRQLAWPPYVHIVGRALRGAACRSNDPRRNRSLPAFAGKRSTSRIGSSQLREKNKSRSFGRAALRSLRRCRAQLGPSLAARLAPVVTHQRPEPYG